MHAEPPVAAQLPTPEVWEPGLISQAFHDAAPAFTPDGATVYFGRSGGAEPPIPTIFVSHRRGGTWSVPTAAPFSDGEHDLEPAIAPDGSHMIFVSSRPAHPGGAPLEGAWAGKSYPGGGGALWRMERRGNGWGAPWRLPDPINSGSSTFAPAIARDGSLYFMRPDPATQRFRLYRASFVHGAYAQPQPLPFSTGEYTDVDPAIAPDESFLVFGSSASRVGLARDMDLFIVFKAKDGRWGAPVHLGPRVNAPGSDAEARLSPDQKRLFFSSERIAPNVAKQAMSWNNGRYNIWSIPLVPEALARLKAESLGGLPVNDAAQH